MAEINYLKTPTAQILKIRFAKVQEELKQSKCIKLGDFREFVLDKEPEYNCPEGWEKIKNTWYGKNADLRVVELIQEYKVVLTKITE